MLMPSKRFCDAIEDGAGRENRWQNMILLSFLKRNLNDRAQLAAAENRLLDARKGHWRIDNDMWIPEGLTHDSWQIRNVAVKLIGEGKRVEYTGSLAGLMTDRSQAGFIRRNSAIALQGFDSVDHQVLETFSQALDDPYWEVRTEAALGLARHGQPDARITADLIGRIYRRSPDRIPDYPVFWPKRIYREKNFEVRAAMIRALGSVMNDRDKMHALEIPLAEDIWKVRDAALDAFIRAAGRLQYPADRIRSALSGLDLTCTEFIPTFPIRETFSRLSDGETLRELSQRETG